MAQLNEQDRVELVAYLDGELNEEAAQAFEARLNRDRQLRAEAEALKKTWDLLDYLPRAEASTSFTHRTLERLAVQKTAPQTSGLSRRWAWAAPAGWAAAVLLAMVSGLLLAHRLWPPASQSPQPDAPVDVEALIFKDKDVIRNKRLYENAPPVSGLRELAREFEEEGDDL